jgi:competence protein ComEA
MRLPFFRSSKVDTTKLAVTAPTRSSTPRSMAPHPNPPPVSTSRANLHMAETQLMSHPLNAPKAATATEPSEASTGDRRPDTQTNGQTIPLALSSLTQQLPGNFLATVGTENIRRITVNIPAEWVLPQLARGRVAITLADLMPLLPEDVQRRPFPAGNSQHPIVLPLADIVSALPVDLMQRQNQTEVDLDTPEFTQFPNLIDDGTDKPATEEQPQIQEPAAGAESQASAPEVSTPPAEETVAPEAPASASVEQEQEAPCALAEHMAKPIPAVNETPTQPVASQPASDVAGIAVSLRSLVAVMPDQYFICPRTDLWRRIDLDTRVALPSELVLPQLKIARVRLPLAVAIGLMPRSILASPLPAISDETIPIALQEIVPQLPVNLFASQTRQSDLEEIDFSDSEIPTPFAEKDFTPATVEIRAPESVQLPPPPAPAEPKPLPETIEVAVASLEDEAVSIFAEKSAAAEAAATETSQTREPVVEQPPAIPEANVEPPATVEPATVTPVAETASPQAEIEEETVSTETSEADEAAAIAAEAQVAAPASSQPPVVPEPGEQAVTEQPPTVEASEATEQVVAPTAEEAEAEDSDTAPEVAEESQISEPAAPVPVAGSTPDQVLANLNRWSIADLARIDGISPVVAERIIEFRNTHGGFKSIEDLRQIPGISQRLFHSLAHPPRRALNRLFGIEHNDELTLQEIVRLTSQLKGVAGCILAMSDGVFLTGELPPHLDRETISVFAPQLFRKVARYMKELRAGQVTRLSVFTDQQPISIFHAGEIFLIVLHDNRHFSKALLRRCERISLELARLCRQRSAE